MLQTFPDPNTPDVLRPNTPIILSSRPYRATYVPCRKHYISEILIRRPNAGQLDVGGKISGAASLLARQMHVPKCLASFMCFWQWQLCPVK
jgi:hypothetical protein